MPANATESVSLRVLGEALSWPSVRLCIRSVVDGIMRGNKQAPAMPSMQVIAAELARNVCLSFCALQEIVITRMLIKNRTNKQTNEHHILKDAVKQISGFKHGVTCQTYPEHNHEHPQA